MDSIYEGWRLREIATGAGRVKKWQVLRESTGGIDTPDYVPGFTVTFRDDAAKVARLIAAAPDLLEACQAAMGRLEQLQAEVDLDGRPDPGSCPTCNQIRDAIRKAIGEG